MSRRDPLVTRVVEKVRDEYDLDSEVLQGYAYVLERLGKHVEVAAYSSASRDRKGAEFATAQAVTVTRRSILPPGHQTSPQQH